MVAPAQNVLLAYPNLADVGPVYTPALSGGSWEALLPLVNLQNEELSLVARSTNALAASTQFDIDFGVARPVRLRALPKHNISQAGKIRVRSFLSLPFADWATVGDGSWTAQGGTPTRAAAATTANGVSLDLIGDDNAASAESFYRAIAFTGDGVKSLAFIVKRSSAYNGHYVQIYDSTAAAARLTCNINFTGVTPIVACPVGTLVAVTAYGDGWLIECLSTAVTAANANRLYVSPTTGTVGDMAAFYVGSIMLWNATTDQLGYDSGLLDVWPVVYPSGSLPAGRTEEISGGGDGKFTTENAVGFNIGFVNIAPTYSSARHERWEIVDTANPAGYIELARLFVALGYQPTINASYGLKLGVIDDTVVQKTDGGAKIFMERSKARTLTFVMDGLPNDEALANLFDLHRRAGISRQMYVVFDPTDTYHLHRRSFLATQRDLSALEQSYFFGMGVPIALEECL